MSAVTVDVARSTAEETLRSVQALRATPAGLPPRPAVRPRAQSDACEPALGSHPVTLATSHMPGPAPSRPRVRLVPVGEPARTSSAEPLVVPPTLDDRVAALRARDRSAVDVEPDEPRREADGDVRALAAAIAQASVEAVTGRRPVAQLARWLAPGVFQALRARAGLTARSPRTAPVRAARGAVVRRVLGNALGPHTYEACAVVDDGTRVRAVGLRLESHRGAWRVTELDLA